MKIISPRCELCGKKEFRNRIDYGYIIDGKVFHKRVKMCKDCELNHIEKVAEDRFGNPIYVKLLRKKNTQNEILPNKSD